MDISLIDARAVREGLRAIRFEKPLASNSLLDMDGLVLLLHEHGAADSPQTREWLLARYLLSLTLNELARRRGDRHDRPTWPPSSEQEIAQLKADFGASSRELEGWSYLWFRYFGTARLPVSEIVSTVHVSERTLLRRLEAGHAALAAVLREAESAASRKLALIPNVPARERVIIRAAAGLDRRVSETMAELLCAMRGDGRAARLTTAEMDAIVQHRPSDLTEYRLVRIAAWSLPRYRMDERFVALSLLVDQGPMAASGRWRVTDKRYDDLRDLLADVSDPAFVVIGPPGSGKTSLLRRFELDAAIDVVRRAGAEGPVLPMDERDDLVAFYVELGHYAPAPSVARATQPKRWLADRWSAQYPRLPSLDTLLSQGRVVLLLDALNEMPVSGEEEYHWCIHSWKEFLHELSAEATGNRVIFSCRTLDYSAPLSTPEQSVPQVRVEPLTDTQVRLFLQRYAPGQWQAVWRQLDGTDRLSLYRTPYFLRLLAEQVSVTGQLPEGEASLFTSFVRQALRREVERDNMRFAAGRLLTPRDRLRITQWLWSDSHQLPDQGMLVPKLAELAYTMQVRRPHGEQSQVHLATNEVLALLGDSQDDEVLQAGTALGIIEDDLRCEQIAFVHQLMQEYFAARHMAAAPDESVVRAPWRIDDVKPKLEETVRRLGSADPLPPPSPIGWEETTSLAAAMTEDTDEFVRRIMAANLTLAGRCAAQPDVRPRLSPRVKADLRAQLAARSRDPETDLRARIAAADMLGKLGDPRFKMRAGAHGGFVMPMLVEIPGGTYVIGEDQAHWYEGLEFAGHVPQHALKVAPFAIGRFPITNAEWDCFMAAGGYEDERWWDTRAAGAWRDGEGTMAAARRDLRTMWREHLERPSRLDDILQTGRITQDLYDKWLERMRMSDDEFGQYLQREFPDRPKREPRHWRDERFNRPLQPVVGISWFEARAYCNWLAAQTGLAFRLPTEAEWEAAARGIEGRLYPYGDALDPWRCNVGKSHIRQTTPVGVFPGGDSPAGLVDMSGNTCEWTSSVWGKPGEFVPSYGYPYDPDDGREDPDAPPTICRVLRGGSWNGIPLTARATFRLMALPDFATFGHGLRVALARPSLE